MATYPVSTVDDLIAAVLLSNTSSVEDKIELAAGTYDLNSYSGASGARTTAPFATPGGPSANINGLPIITQPLIIQGMGTDPAATVIERNGSTLYRLLYVISGKQLTLINLTLKDGKPSDPNYSGGGIYNKGTLVVSKCILGPDNKSNYGGAVRNSGTATFDKCEIFGNRVGEGGGGGNGGGIYNDGLALTITDSVIRNNIGTDGGGIMSTTTAHVENCTLYGNTAIYGAGLACYQGSLTVEHCDIYSNFSNGAALYARGAGTLTANYNCIYWNATGLDYSVLNESSVQMDATHNYWGKTEGPVGQDVYGNVLTSNFYCYRICEVDDGTLTYSYNRENAAYYAIGLSQSNFPTDGNSIFPYGSGNLTGSAPACVGGQFSYDTVLTHTQGATGSGIFMSEVIFAGGMPMTVDPNNNDCDINDDGWRVCCGENEKATRVWRGHDRIVTHFLGSVPAISSSNTLAYNDLLTYMKFDLGADGGGQWKSGHETDGPQYLYDLFASTGPLGHIDTGDYVYLDQNTKGYHGFIIVGWGPALNCPDAIDAEYGVDFFLSRQNNGAEIPYVADFCYGYDSSVSVNYTGWLQDPRPRPFYCSAAEISDSQITSRFGFNSAQLADYLAMFQTQAWRRFIYKTPMGQEPCYSQQICLPLWRFFHLPDTFVVEVNQLYCLPSVCE